MGAALAEHRTRQRVSSRGFDPLLGGIGLLGNPSADLLAAGLRVPYQYTGAFRSTVPGGGLVQRYLFQLCSIGIGSGLWLTDLGQMSVLGSEQMSGTTGGDAPSPTNPIFPNVIEQTSAAFRFADCHPIRWGVRRVHKPRALLSGQDPLSTSSFSRGWTDNSGLIFETAAFPKANLDWKGTPDNYLTLAGYTAPGGGGIFPGEPVGGELGCFDSLDFRQNDPNRRAFEPVWVKPGGQLVFYALVDQTNPSSRAVIQVLAQFPLPTTGMPENAFIGDWPATIQFAVGGSMTVEMRESDGGPIPRRRYFTGAPS
ncbi:MAG TPA: hypothetical protein VNV25_25655 [Gemmatimonadaceae bacterium]|jgi:hypothetical protein|nr:hypothetical protein [Gemmatimonadaceae bacterium]